MIHLLYRPELFQADRMTLAAFLIIIDIFISYYK